MIQTLPRSKSLEIMSDIPASPSINVQLANAVAEVAKANDFLIQMRQQSAVARNNETDALNRLNKEQKRFDELVEAVKKSAPPETDWQRRTVMRKSAE